MVEVCAEFGQSCRGNLEVAKTQAAVAADAGCSWVKLQTFEPSRLAGAGAKRYWDPSLGGADSQLDTFAGNGMLAAEDWKELAAYCATLGIGFMSSPFDLEAVDLLADAGVGAIKVASGEITHRQMLERIAQTGLPVVLSTGAATLAEVDRALVWLDPLDNITLLACTLAYPTGDGDANLGRIETLKMFGHPVGYSDHTLRTDTALAAAALGATMLEKHCTLDAGGGVPDDLMALEPGRLRQYVTYAELGARMRGDGVVGPVASELAARHGARRSLHAARTIEAGEVFGPGDFVCLRPAGPYRPMEEPLLFGRAAACRIVSGEQIQTSHIV